MKHEHGNNRGKRARKNNLAERTAKTNDGVFMKTSIPRIKKEREQKEKEQKEEAANGKK